MSTQWDMLINEIGIPRDVVMHCIRPFMGISEAEVRNRHKWCMNNLKYYCKSRWNAVPRPGMVKLCERIRKSPLIALRVLLGNKHTLGYRRHSSRTFYGGKSTHSKLMDEIIGRKRSCLVVGKRMRRLYRLLDNASKQHKRNSGLE